MGFVLHNQLIWVKSVMSPTYLKLYDQNKSYNVSYSDYLIIF